MNILSINPGHNGSVCLLVDGNISLYIEEERLTRVKYSGNPILSIDKALEITDKIDYLVIGGTNQQPSLTWEETDIFTLYLKKKIGDTFKTVYAYDQHHFAHACSAFYNSGFEDAISIVVDGCGSYSDGKWEAESVFDFSGEVEHVYSTYNSSSYIGIVKTYEAVTQHCGWHPIEAGKTMGLSSYGKYIGNIDLKTKCVPNFPSGANLKDVNKFSNEDLAKTIQRDTCNQVTGLIKKYPGRKICISGGYGLNCVANYDYLDHINSSDLYVEPISHDGGTSIGLAKQLFKQINPDHKFDKLRSLYLGPNQTYSQVGEPCSTIEVAKLLSEGKIVALFQGR